MFQKLMNKYCTWRLKEINTDIEKLENKNLKVQFSVEEKLKNEHGDPIVELLYSYLPKFILINTNQEKMAKMYSIKNKLELKLS